MKKLVSCAAFAAATYMAGTTTQAQGVKEKEAKKGQCDKKDGKTCCKKEGKARYKKEADKKISDGCKEKVSCKTKTGCKDVQCTRDRGGKKK